LFGGVTEQNLFDGDALFDAYVDKNLPEVEDEYREKGGKNGILKFDYFLMIY